MTSGITHPVFKTWIERLLTGGINKSVDLGPFKSDRYMLISLEYLERPGHSHDAGRAGKETFIQRIKFGSIGKIFLASCQRPVLVRNASACHYTLACLHINTSDMAFKIKGGAGLCLPDALQVRFAVGNARKLLRNSC